MRSGDSGRGCHGGMDARVHLAPGDAVQGGRVLGAPAVEEADLVARAKAQDLAGVVRAPFGQLHPRPGPDAFDEEARPAHAALLRKVRAAHSPSVASEGRPRWA